MAKNLQHLCQKLDAEAEFDSSIRVDDNAIAAAEVTRESRDDMTLEDEEDNNDKNAITVTQASSMA